METAANSQQRKAPEAASPGRRLEDLPSPPGLPWIGNIHQLNPDRIHARLEGWAQKLGSTYVLKLGPKRVLVTGDVDIALSALRDRPGRFRRLSAIEAVAAEMGFNGLFSVEGEAWRPQRNLVSRAMAPYQLESFFPLLRQITDRLRRRWQHCADSGTPIDALRDLTSFTVDTTSTLVFGQDINTLEAGEDTIQRHIGVVFPKLNARVSAVFPYWRYLKLPSDRRLERSLAALRSFAQETIEAARARMRRAPPDKPANLLEAMLALADAPGSGFSDDDVYANIVTLLLAGEDTTAYSIAWAMHILAGDLELQSRLHAAARDALGDALSPQTFADTAKLGLFEGAAFEAMRLRPVVPLVFLEAREDLVLGGIFIPKATPVFLLTRPAGLDDRNYAGAQTFDPERWAGRREGHDPRAFIQFGAGPRFCPGRYLAVLEMKMVLATLFRNFSIAHAEDAALTRERFAFTMMPSRLRLHLRPWG